MWTNHSTLRGTLKDKKYSKKNYYYFIHNFFYLKISLVPSIFFDIGPCTLVLVLEAFFFKKKYQ